METINGDGLLGRVAEKILVWVGVALLAALVVALWRMSPETRAAIFAGIWKTCAWVAGVSVLPWIGRLFMRRIIEIGSNWAGVALVGAYVLVDLLLGIVLMNGVPSGAWPWLAGIAALAVGATYNYLVTDYLAEAAGG